MMNIEKLAIEHGATQYNGNIIFERVEHLEAFAKAYASSLQSSEPVAEVKDAGRFGLIVEWISGRSKKLKAGDKLFTHPPASVPLEKYKNLLKAITVTIEENRHLADGDKCTLRHLVKAIAEAEGKEG